jgi:hypothetical protein
MVRIARSGRVIAAGLSFALFTILPTLAGHVWYQDRGGGSGYYENASWANLQAAITLAQSGGSATGMVKISGDITRTNASWGHLGITNGGVITLSGGWGWDLGSHAPTTRSGQSMLSANSVALASNIRVFHLTNAPDVTLGSLEITGGRLVDAYGGCGIDVQGASHRLVMTNLYIHHNVGAVSGASRGGQGAGINVNGSVALQGLRISDTTVEANTASGDYGTGGGLFLNNAGDVTSPMIIERCAIRQNVAGGQAGYSTQNGAGMRMDSGVALLVNSRITGNKADFFGSGICKLSGTLRVFGCLLSDNTRINGSPGQVLYSYTSTGIGSLILANCTVIQPQDDPNFPANDSNAPTYVTFINSVLRLGELSLPADLRVGYYSGWVHAQMKACTIDVPAFRYMDGPKAAGVWHETNTLAGAVTMVDDQGRYRFHSLTAANVDANPALASDRQGATSFATTNGVNPYQLLGTDPSVDTASCASSNDFAYVDLNLNGAYNALVDVIVAGTPPAGTHFVYTTDLMGNRRLKARGLDRGCYEWQPGRGTVVIMR